MFERQENILALNIKRKVAVTGLKNIIIKSKEDYKAVTANKVGGWYTIVFKNLSKVNQFFK